MFFQGQNLELFFRFVWLGLIFGASSVLVKLIIKLFKRNLYVTNLICFVYWLGFGMVYNLMCVYFYNYTFCWFGLLGMVVGMILIKISIEFFFDRLVSFIYNKIILVKTKRKIIDGKLQTNKKVWEHC